MCKKRRVEECDESQQNHQYPNKISKTEHLHSNNEGASESVTFNGSSKHSESVVKLLISLDAILQEPEVLHEIGEEGYDRCKNLRSILARKVRGRTGNGTSHASNEDEASPGVPAIPKPTTVTPWTTSSIPHAKPPLPKILDPALEKAAFTHSAIGGSSSYERLEWVGDVYLGMIATLLISSTFPDLSPGRCTQLREKLVKNETLASFSHDYDFRQRAILPREFGPDASHSGGKRGPKKDGLKVMGDIFEAYCAALVYSDPEHGIDRLATWMKALWAHVLALEIRALQPAGAATMPPPPTATEAAQAARPKNPKELLNCKLVSKGVRLRYRDEAPEAHPDIPNGTIFVVGVYLDGWGEQGKRLGVGKAISKKEAGQKAAEAALAGGDVGIYERMKIAHEAKRKAESLDAATSEVNPSTVP